MTRRSLLKLPAVLPIANVLVHAGPPKFFVGEEFSNAFLYGYAHSVIYPAFEAATRRLEHHVRGHLIDPVVSATQHPMREAFVLVAHERGVEVTSEMLNDAT
jgi:hypothetical protein